MPADVDGLMGASHSSLASQAEPEHRSLAASIYSIVHFGRLYGTRHRFRLIFLHIQLFVNLFSLFLTWLCALSPKLTAIAHTVAAT